MFSSDAELIEAFLAASSDRSLREAGALAGVSHNTVGRWRKGERTDLHPSTRRGMLEYLERVDRGEVEETPEDATAGTMPDVRFLLPRAREIYDRAVGSYLTRGWPQPIIERAAWDLVNYILGANTLRSAGPGRPELTEDEQVMVLERMREHVERAYGPNGIVRRF